MTFPWLLFDRIETRIRLPGSQSSALSTTAVTFFSLSFIIKIFPEMTTLGIPHPVDSYS